MTGYLDRSLQIERIYDEAAQRWQQKQPPFDAATLSTLKAQRIRPEDARARWRAVEKLAAFQAHEMHLDLGCGSALMALPALRAAQTRYIGLDLSHLTLAITATHTSQHTPGFSQGEAAALPFAAASFDIVTAIGMSEYWPDDYLQLMLREIARVLAPNGRLVIDFLDGTKAARQQTEAFEALRGLTVYSPTYTDIQTMLSAAGLQQSRLLSTERRQVVRANRAA